MPPLDNEVILSSVKIVGREFIHEIETGLKGFENYLISEFG